MPALEEPRNLNYLPLESGPPASDPHFLVHQLLVSSRQMLTFRNCSGRAVWCDHRACTLVGLTKSSRGAASEFEDPRRPAANVPAPGNRVAQIDASTKRWPSRAAAPAVDRNDESSIGPSALRPQKSATMPRRRWLVGCDLLASGDGRCAGGRVPHCCRRSRSGTSARRLEEIAGGISPVDRQNRARRGRLCRIRCGVPDPSPGRRSEFLRCHVPVAIRPPPHPAQPTGPTDTQA